MPEKVHEFDFQLLEISLVESTFNFSQRKIESDAPFHFEINLEHRFNLERNSILILTTVLICAKQEPNVVVGRFKSATAFGSQNITILLDEQHKVKHNSRFLQSLNGMAVSTTRGMLFMHTKGTPLHYAFLPVIDVAALTVLQKS